MRRPLPAPARRTRGTGCPVSPDEPMASSPSHGLAMQYAQLAMSYHLRDVEGLVTMDYIFCYRELLPGTVGDARRDGGPGHHPAPGHLLPAVCGRWARPRIW